MYFSWHTWSLAFSPRCNREIQLGNWMRPLKTWQGWKVMVICKHSSRFMGALESHLGSIYIQSNSPLQGYIVCALYSTRRAPSQRVRRGFTPFTPPFVPVTQDLCAENVNRPCLCIYIYKVCLCLYSMRVLVVATIHFTQRPCFCVLARAADVGQHGETSGNFEQIDRLDSRIAHSSRLSIIHIAFM